jgi:hypothetical protein
MGREIKSGESLGHPPLRKMREERGTRGFRIGTEEFKTMKGGPAPWPLALAQTLCLK